MEAQNDNQSVYPSPSLFRINEEEDLLKRLTIEAMLHVVDALNEFKTFFRQNSISNFNDLLTKVKLKESKQSFLIFKHQRYFTVSTENTAFFYVRNDSTMMTGFDGQEYPINYSLEQIQSMLPEKQFFRLNRQYLINFAAIKEVEHYFARKLFVKLVVSVSETLLVSKKKSVDFLKWLEDR